MDHMNSNPKTVSFVGLKNCTIVQVSGTFGSSKNGDFYIGKPMDLPR